MKYQKTKKKQKKNRKKEFFFNVLNYILNKN